MSKKWLPKFLATVLAAASCVVFIPSAHADSFSWETPSALAGLAGYSASLSSDGSVMLIGESTTGLYLSTDTGTTFNQVNSPNVTGTRYAVAVSGDGNKMFAVNYHDSSVAYSLDRGATWSLNSNAVAINAGAACMSSDGSVWMTGGLNSANGYVSTNNGTTWSKITSIGLGSWRSCALNSNGTKRYFLNFADNLWISNNSGTNWSQITYYIVGANCVAATEDASLVIQSQGIGSASVYRSSNPSGGFSAYSNSGSGGSPYAGCAISGNGTTMAVGRVGNKVRLSVDSGTTWSDESALPNGQWNSVAISRDGKKMIALSNTAIGNFLGTYTPPMALTLGIGAAPVMNYRTQNTVTAVANSPGKVTFYANGKKIGGCVGIATVSLVATCQFKPTNHGVVTLTARIIPTNVNLSTVTSKLFTTSVVRRSTSR